VLGDRRLPVKERLWILLGVFFSLVGLCCGGCLWWGIEWPRFDYEFDIGRGRTLCIWSIRRDFEIDVNPPMIYYRLDQWDKVLVPMTFLEPDDGGEYQFKVVFADGGRLACVYEKVLAKKYSSYLLIFDADSGESWPRLRDDETESHPGVMDKWRERYRRLKAENPELPTPEPFKGK
jgi:hypothetical protein